jgi:hypothetical protein
MGIKNWVTVQLKSNSYLLGESSPIEIRDSRLNLIKQLHRGQRVELDDGLYEISAVLEDGQKHRRLVQLQGGTQEDITLDAQEEKHAVRPPSPRAKMASSSGTASDHASISILARAALDMVKSDLSLDSELEPSSYSTPEKEVPIEFLGCHGAVLSNNHITPAADNSWFFEPAPNLDIVPRADFLIHGQKITISLPLNPEGTYPLNACEVVTTINAGALELRAWISRERTVASTMQHMLASGYILHAARIAGEALELLRDKYQDPTGALLGALILHKIGQLEPRRSWVRNLAIDFDWLNDGKVLLAVLLSREESKQEEALSLALRASRKPMMFTESYSLLLDLLRRWPWPTNYERDLALESMAMKTPYTNWDSMMFYQLSNVEE